MLELEQDERDAFASLNYTDEVLRQETGAPEAFGEAGYTTLERMWARPTCDVNGIFGGYAGQGAKTVLPAWGGAKVSMRLVPDQDPEKIADQEALEQFADATAGEDVRADLIARAHGGAR